MSSLSADNLANDPRISEAKKLLLEALADEQSKINTIRPPIQALQEDYKKLIESFSKTRGGDLFYPYLGSGIGKGTLVELADGSVKYDFITGIGVHFLGHNNPKLCEALIDAALSNTVMQGNLQQNRDSAELCELLKKVSGLDCVFLTTSGVMANENALKIAFQNRFPAKRILSFEHAFAGRSLTLSQVTDKAAFREGLPPTLLIDYIPFFDPDDPEASTRVAVTTLKKLLKRYPNDYAAMIFELVQGENGFNVGEREFFIALMKILKEAHVLTIIDEVQTFGRTPSLFAFQHFGLEEYVDLVTIGKVSQACATLFRSDLKPKPGLISQTFTASTSAIKTSLAIINELIHGNYYGPQGKIAQIHDRFVQHLQRMQDKDSNKICGPFGIGAMIAFTPLQGDSAAVKKFAHKLFDAGVISFIAGQNPMRLRFLVPAGAITMDDIDRVMKLVEENI